MQVNNGFFTQTQQQVDTSVSGTLFMDSRYATDEQEFSLSSIQERLGSFSAVEEKDTVASSDVLPSGQTLSMNYQREYYQPEQKTATKVSAKTKVIAASYSIVVLALICAIAFCSVGVGTTFSAVQTLDATYSEVVDTVDQLAVQVQTQDTASLVTKATELGFVDVSQANSATFASLATRPAQNLTVESNWFDSLCDWLCNVFGN